MTPSSRFPIDGSQLLAAALALVVVASLSGAATTALLSDREDVTVELDVEQSDVSKFRVTPLTSCEPATAETAADLELVAEFDVHGDGCAQITVWVSKSWVDENAGDVDDVLIGHDGGSGWTYFETTVEAERHGTYKLRATTDGFSPFGLFVPNESESADGVEASDSTASNVGPNASEQNESSLANESVGENESIDGNASDEENVGNSPPTNGSSGPNTTTSMNGAANESESPREGEVDEGTAVTAPEPREQHESPVQPDETSASAQQNESTTAEEPESTTKESKSPDDNPTSHDEPASPDEPVESNDDGTDGEIEEDTNSTANNESAALSPLVVSR
ncbi:hypothetical protein [Halobellus captivus]|uniref:hypothetical protein n=1 Tax=Halobellus captivus TaxID=2592614 RepID=UPI0013968E0A|nr:hypothetical protein [Halobellus captivus]